MIASNCSPRTERGARGARYAEGWTLAPALGAEGSYAGRRGRVADQRGVIRPTPERYA